LEKDPRLLAAAAKKKNSGQNTGARLGNDREFGVGLCPTEIIHLLKIRTLMNRSTNILG
jgi:hypothetical protein